MFAAQKSSGGGTVAKPIPSTCAETDYAKVECVPTISKGQMATILADNDGNVAYTKGAAFLGAPVGTQLVYNRRADTSGTQAGAQAYFLGLPCSGNPLSIVSQPDPGASKQVGQPLLDASGNAVLDASGNAVLAIKVFAHKGTGDVRTQLNTSAYGIGIMSGENNQTDTGTSWKWIRVQGAAMSESAATSASSTNSASVKNGSYDYYYESKVNPGTSGTASTFWTEITGSLNTLTAPVGLLNSADLGGYNKGSNACQPNSSN
jgi:hypothetical protein